MPRFEIIDGRCVVPNGVTEILEEEFSGCRELKEIVIPDTVVCIGFAASVDPDKRTDLIEALRGRRIKDITLHVPEGSVSKYGNHPFFRKFQHIT